MAAAARIGRRAVCSASVVLLVQFQPLGRAAPDHVPASRLAAAAAEQVELPARVAEVVLAAPPVPGRAPTRQRVRAAEAPPAESSSSGRSRRPTAPPASAASCRRRAAVRSRVREHQERAGDGGAAERFLHGPEAVHRAGRLHQHQVRGREAEAGEAGGPGVGLGGDPQHRAAGARQQEGAEAGGGAGLGGQHLMHRGAGQAAAAGKRRVDRFAEGDAAAVAARLRPPRRRSGPAARCGRAAPTAGRGGPYRGRVGYGRRRAGTLGCVHVMFV